MAAQSTTRAYSESNVARSHVVATVIPRAKGTAMPDPAASRSCAIAVMAKAPRAGMVKTRLSPPLLPDEAAADERGVPARHHRPTSSSAAQQAGIAGLVAYAPAGLESLFDGLLAAGTQLVLADGTGDMPDGVDRVRPQPAARDARAVRPGLPLGVRAELRQPDPADRAPGARRRGAGRRAATAPCWGRPRMAATTCSA